MKPASKQDKESQDIQEQNTAQREQEIGEAEAGTAKDKQNPSRKENDTGRSNEHEASSIRRAGMSGQCGGANSGRRDDFRRGGGGRHKKGGRGGGVIFCG